MLVKQNRKRKQETKHDKVLVSFTGVPLTFVTKKRNLSYFMCVSQSQWENAACACLFLLPGWSAGPSWWVRVDVVTVTYRHTDGGDRGSAHCILGTVWSVHSLAKRSMISSEGVVVVELQPIHQCYPEIYRGCTATSWGQMSRDELHHIGCQTFVLPSYIINNALACWRCPGENDTLMHVIHSCSSIITSIVISCKLTIDIFCKLT